MSAELEAIRKRFDAIIPGPWRWYGNTATDQVYLATTDRGRLFILMPHTRVEEYVYDHHEMETYTTEDARQHYKTRWCPYHREGSEGREPRHCCCDEIRDFLAGELDPQESVLDGARHWSSCLPGERRLLSRSVKIHEDLRFPVPFAGHGMDAETHKKQHGGTMRSYRDRMPKYEVLGYRTIIEWEMDQGGVQNAHDQLYREDFCGLDNPEAEFIAHAPEDIGYLLAEIDRLRGLNPKGSLSYECSDCGAEVDIREAEAL